MKILSMVNQKGGVGKTTTAISLAHGLALQGKQVLLIDFDPQGNCATALRMEREPGAFYLITLPSDATGTQMVCQYVRDTGRENLWLIAGDQQTTAAAMLMQTLDKPISHIRECLQRFARNGSNLDYILLDTPPTTGGIQERAMWASDLVLIPTTVEFLAVAGVQAAITTLKALKEKKGWKGGLMGILPTQIDRRKTEHKTLHAELLRVYGDRVLAPIHTAATLGECPSFGVTIFEKDPRSQPAQEYAALVQHVLRY